MIVGIIEGMCEDTSLQDSGCAFIATVYDEATATVPDGIFARIQSWSEQDPPQHPIAALITGQRVRITIEVVS